MSWPASHDLVWSFASLCSSIPQVGEARFEAVVGVGAHVASGTVAAVPLSCLSACLPSERWCLTLHLPR